MDEGTYTIVAKNRAGTNMTRVNLRIKGIFNTLQILFWVNKKNIFY